MHRTNAMQTATFTQMRQRIFANKRFISHSLFVLPGLWLSVRGTSLGTPGGGNKKLFLWYPATSTVPHRRKFSVANIALDRPFSYLQNFRSLFLRDQAREAARFPGTFNQELIALIRLERL